MISEPQQEQAALHALGLLDADEADAFEHEMAGDPDLRALVRDLQDAATSLAVAAQEPASFPPPADLKARVLHRVQSEGVSGAVLVPTKQPDQSPVHTFSPMVRPRFGWVPWALAALLLGCCTFLAVDRNSLLRQIEGSQRLAGNPAPPPLESLSKVSFLELEPTPDAPVKPRAAVLWDATRHQGVLRITQLAPPAPGKDYQLWAVEAARKEPVSAGLVRVNPDGVADIAFQPEPIPGDNKVVALAISLEQAGGSPTNQGPILFLGKF